MHHLPNIISFLRILLVAPIVWALLNHRYDLAVVLFVIAGISDGVDGYLAKRFGWESRFGGVLDAIADKLLLVSTFIVLWLLTVFPLWLVALIIMRDLLIVGGGVIYNLKVEKFNAEPSLMSKLNTVLQIILATVGVLSLGLIDVLPVVIYVLTWAVAITVVMSGFGYANTWGRRVVKRDKHG
jgi:cardiolipin synthase